MILVLAYHHLAISELFQWIWLKIDAHFIQNLQQDQANQSIIKAINTIAHGFGIKTIAEGVENRCQLETLRTIGIDYVQGYLIENLSGL